MALNFMPDLKFVSTYNFNYYKKKEFISQGIKWNEKKPVKSMRKIPRSGEFCDFGRYVF